MSRKHLLLPPPAAMLGGRDPYDLHRRLQERSTELALKRSVASRLGAWQDAKELRAAKLLCYSLFKSAGRCWFHERVPGLLQLGYYTGAPTPLDPMARKRVIMFEALTYSDLFKLVATWRERRS